MHFVYTGLQDGRPFKEVIEMNLGKNERSLTGKSVSYVNGAQASVFAFSMHK